MKMYLYSIRDNLAEVFNKPYTSINDGTAVRAFQGAMQENPDKDDYSLYCIGEYHDHDGSIIPHPPVRVINGFEITQHKNVIDSAQIPAALKEQAS